MVSCWTEELVVKKDMLEIMGPYIYLELSCPCRGIMGSYGVRSTIETEIWGSSEVGNGDRVG